MVRGLVILGFLLAAHSAHAEFEKPKCRDGSRSLTHNGILRHRIIAETPRTYLVWKDEVPRAIPFDYHVVEVFEQKSDRYLGRIYIRIDDDGYAHLPIALEVDGQGLGFGTESKFAALKYVFDEWNVRVVSATIRPGNIASQRLHEKLGFHRVKNSATDLHVYILNRSDFEVVRQAFE